MPYTDRSVKNAYQLAFVRSRRDAWLRENGPCIECGSWISLQVDHVDPSTKIDHKVWSWSEQRRLSELAKCVVRCQPCHINKTHAERGDRVLVHGTMYRGYQRGCRCTECRRANANYERNRRRARKALLTESMPGVLAV